MDFNNRQSFLDDKRKVGTVSTITFKAVEESTTTDEESKPVVLL